MAEQGLADSLLLIDGGDLLEKNKAYQPFYIELYTEAMNLMGYDAFNIGRRELLEGIDGIRHIGAIARFPLISTNLRATPASWEPYVIKTIQGIRIAILGIVSPSPGLPDTFTFGALNETIKKQVKDLDGKADLFVLNAQASRDEISNLIKQVPEIDLVISLKENSVGKDEIIGSTLLLSPGNKGEYVGMVDIKWDQNKKQIITMTPSMIALDQTYDGDPEITKLVEVFNRKVDLSRSQALKPKNKNDLQMSPENFIKTMREKEKKNGAPQP